MDVSLLLFFRTVSRVRREDTEVSRKEAGSARWTWVILTGCADDAPPLRLSARCSEVA
jgi:hypothetical protein